MAVATFDFTNLIITLPSGQTSVDVESEIYSEWKRQLLVGPTSNASAPPAFRSIGGDPLTPGIEAGAYFFIQNQDGWRIKPPEEDITVFLNGNLAPEDSAKPVVAPTTGAFTALIVNLQPVTQNVDAILVQAQNAEYNGVVRIDPVSGVSGTTYPVGLRSTPVNNLSDARTIADNLNISVFEVRGSITLNQSFIDKHFLGVGSAESDTIALNGQDVSGTIIEHMDVTGAAGALTKPIEIRSATVDSVTGIRGHIVNSGLKGTIGLVAGVTEIINCYTEANSGLAATIDCNSAVVDVAVHNYEGNLAAVNLTSGTLDVGLNTGRLNLNSTVDGGAVLVDGIGTLTDNSGAGTAVDKKGLVDGLDVKLIKALDAGNVTITGSNPFVVEVLDPDDNSTPIARFEVSPDGRTRTRTL